MQTLPFDTLDAIFDLCTIDDVPQFKLVCKQFYSVLSNSDKLKRKILIDNEILAKIIKGKELNCATDYYRHYLRYREFCNVVRIAKGDMNVIENVTTIEVTNQLNSLMDIIIDSFARANGNAMLCIPRRYGRHYAKQEMDTVIKSIYYIIIEQVLVHGYMEYYKTLIGPEEINKENVVIVVNPINKTMVDICQLTLTKLQEEHTPFPEFKKLGPYMNSIQFIAQEGSIHIAIFVIFNDINIIPIQKINPFLSMDSLIYTVDALLIFFTNYIAAIFNGEPYQFQQCSLEDDSMAEQQTEEPSIEEQHIMQEDKEDARSVTMTGKITDVPTVDVQLSHEAPKKRKYTEDVLLARTQLIRSNFPLDEKTRKSMQEIRDVLADAAERMVRIVKENGEFDIGRLIHAIDTLQTVKNVAIESMLMPQAPM